MHRRSHRPVQDHREGTLRWPRRDGRPCARLYALCRWPCKENGARKCLRRACRFASAHGRRHRFGLTAGGKPCGAFQHAGTCALDRHNCVCVPDLFRFFRLFRYGHRHGTDDRAALSRKLQLSLHIPHGYGVLAAVAYVARHLFPRLCVHPARRQPEGKSARVSEPLHRLGTYRPLARGELELCALGALLLCAAHARPAVLAEAARQAAEGGLGDPFPHHAPARGALRMGALQVHITPARRGGRARHVLRQRQRLYELHRYGGDKEPYVSAHLLRRGGNAGVFVSCEALGARRRGEHPCAEKLFRCGLWRCAGSAAASEHRVPCRQQL